MAQRGKEVTTRLERYLLPPGVPKLETLVAMAEKLTGRKVTPAELEEAKQWQAGLVKRASQRKASVDKSVSPSP